MNTEAVAAWLDQMLRRQDGLREINPEMSVPWTPLQWLVALSATVVALMLVLRVYRWLSRRWATNRRDFAVLLRELDRVDEARLNQRLAHAEAVVSAADLLREGLQMADRRQGGSGLYRTSTEWIRWSGKQDAEQALSQRVEAVLRLHDGLLYFDRSASLDDARQAVNHSRQVLLELSFSADAQHHSQSAGEPSRSAALERPL